MGFYPDQTGQLANPFLKGFLRSQFFDPPVQPFQFIAEAAAGKKIFIQSFLMQPIRLQGFQPFPVCLGPFTFGGRIVEAMAQTESGNLLFNPLKGQLVIITHPDEFLYLFLLRSRDMDRVVGMESQTFRDKHGIPFIGFDFADTEDSAHSGRSKDDAPYLVGSQLVVEAVTEASGLITTEEFHVVVIETADLVHILRIRR